VSTDMEFMNRLFHAALRRDLERVIDSLTQVTHPTTARRAALAEHVDLVLNLLHHHHTGEDTGLWPLVRQRAPDLGSQLDMMEAEHASVAGAIVSTRTAARLYAATSEPSAARRLEEALIELSGVLLPHLDHEETEVMPRVMRALTDRDWSALSRHELRNWNSFALAGTGLVWMADGLKQTERAMFKQQVSPVFYWIVDKRYGPAYRRRTALAFSGQVG
jgi:hemerythrin-like domain-containing protein